MSNPREFKDLTFSIKVAADTGQFMALCNELNVGGLSDEGPVEALQDCFVHIRDYRRHVESVQAQ